MLNKLCIKRIIILSIFFILFFSFNNEVRAATAGTCEYCGYTSGQSCYVYVQLKQSKAGKFSYKYKTKASGKWKKKDSKLKVVGKPKEMSESCPTPLISSSGSGYKIDFKKTPTAVNGPQTRKTTDTFAGVFNGKLEKENGTANGGAGKSTTQADKNGNLTCSYQLPGAYVQLIQKNGKKSYKYAFADEGKTASWKSYKKSDTRYKITDNNGLYSSCPYVSGNNKGATFKTGSQCAGTYSCYGATTINLTPNKNAATGGNDVNEINKRLVGDEIETRSCQEILGDELIEKIQEIVNMVRIMIPILLIVFGIIDFGKAIFVSDENEMKKSQSKFIRRLIVAVGFFMVPSILSLVLNIANKVWEVIPDAENAFCGIKF